MSRDEAQKIVYDEKMKEYQLEKQRFKVLVLKVLILELILRDAFVLKVVRR